MRNPLQEQLLKAGLIKKQQVDDAVRAQTRQRVGKAPPSNNAEQIDARRLQAEKAERDRQLAAEQKAQAHAREVRAQVRQIVENHKMEIAGEVDYRFVDGDKVRNLLVNESIRKQLAKGAAVIVRHDKGYQVVPRSAAEIIYQRGGEIAVDHGRSETTTETSADDEYYKKFEVPDDLIW